MAIVHKEIMERRRSHMESKRISVSMKIQNSTKIYEDEVECIQRGNELDIRPVGEMVFVEEILSEPILERHLSGEELLQEFRRLKAKVRPAVKKMEDIDRLAQQVGTGVNQMSDIFGEN